MKLYFMLVRRMPPVPSPILMEVSEKLRDRGYSVDSGIAEEMLVRSDAIKPEHDLYLLKSHTELTLSLAGILHDQGAQILNPYPSCMPLQDKLIVSSRLRDADIPAPRAWTTADLSLLVPLLEKGPLIMKPHRGHRGAGIHILHRPMDLALVPRPKSPVIIQEYIQGSGEDLKVYVIGENVFAVRKPFSPTSFSKPGRPVPVTGTVRDIALRCGRIFGLGLYGLDLIESQSGPVVVDINYFPGYKGVPDAAPLIADYIDEYARGDFKLDSPAALSSEKPSTDGDHQVFAAFTPGLKS